MSESQVAHFQALRLLEKALKGTKGWRKEAEEFLAERKTKRELTKK